MTFIDNKQQANSAMASGEMPAVSGAASTKTQAGTEADASEAQALGSAATSAQAGSTADASPVAAAESGSAPTPSDVAHKLLGSVAVRSVRAQMAPGYLNLNLFLMVWLFVLGSFLGLVLEDAFHIVVYGEYESRAGLVWGPFSSIYGLGAVVLTLFLNRYYYTHDLIIFLISMVLGAALEFGASWMMETFWHAIAWDYTGTFGSIGGRTNFFFGVMWGALGLFWVRFVMPVIKRVQKFFQARRGKKRGKVFAVVTWIVLVFMTINCIFTVLSIHRQGERAMGIPPKTQIDVMLDVAFPDEWLEARFHNMTVSSSVGNSASSDANAPAAQQGSAGQDAPASQQGSAGQDASDSQQGSSGQDGSASNDPANQGAAPSSSQSKQ